VSTTTRVLVTGGSVAGPAVTAFLDRAGFEVTLLERAPARHDAGQNVDVRGDARDVLARLGLLDAVAGAGTGEVGTRFVTESGRVLASFPVREGAADGPTAELEVLRGELSRLLLGLTEDRVEHRYGDHVVALDQSADGVRVELASGGSQRYDLVVVAEGKRSATRDLALGEPAYRDLGEYCGYGTLDRLPEDDDWWRWCVVPGRRMASVRPDNLGTVRASLAFLAPRVGLDRLGPEEQLAALRERYADLGWEVPRILAGFAARPEEFYFERMEQVTLERWYAGRVVALGDSAWAPSPLAGRGTSLALLGAEALADELFRHAGDPTAAFPAYERRMREHVAAARPVPRALLRLALPESAAVTTVMQGVLGVAGRVARLRAA
jgi:2-polyprenyl-6-methoxyphenol hydroxylase-like FAD-dependent oxidoreductase